MSTTVWVRALYVCWLASFLFLALRLSAWLVATVKQWRQTGVKSGIRLLPYFTSLSNGGNGFSYEQWTIWRTWFSSDAAAAAAELPSLFSGQVTQIKSSALEHSEFGLYCSHQLSAVLKMFALFSFFGSTLQYVLFPTVAKKWWQHRSSWGGDVWLDTVCLILILIDWGLNICSFVMLRCVC